MLNERLNTVISDLRTLFREYRALNQEEQKKVRHLCYQQNGDFGKALFNLETVFGATEEKLETKYVVSLRRRAAELGMVEVSAVDVATLEAYVKRAVEEQL